jgi:hypothetical protein
MPSSLRESSVDASVAHTIEAFVTAGERQRERQRTGGRTYADAGLRELRLRRLATTTAIRRTAIAAAVAAGTNHGTPSRPGEGAGDALDGTESTGTPKRIRRPRSRGRARNQPPTVSVFQYD